MVYIKKENDNRPNGFFGFFKIGRPFLAKDQDWNPGQWEWNEGKVETLVGKKISKKTSFMTSLIPKRGNWNLDCNAAEKKEIFRKFSDEQNSMHEVTGNMVENEKNYIVPLCELNQEEYPATAQCLTTTTTARQNVGVPAPPPFKTDQQINSNANARRQNFGFRLADQLPANNQPLTASITKNSRLQYTASCLNPRSNSKVKSNKNVLNNKKKQLKQHSVQKSDGKLIGNNFRLVPQDQCANLKDVKKLRPISWGALQTRKYFESSLCAENFLVEENHQCLRHSLLQHQNFERIKHVSVHRVSASILTVCSSRSSSFKNSVIISERANHISRSSNHFLPPNCMRYTSRAYVASEDDENDYSSLIYNDDYEQDYAEIDSFVWKDQEEEETAQLTHTMAPKSFTDFGNLIVTFSPNFVQNIECCTNDGRIVSIIPEKAEEEKGKEVQCFVVEQNNKYVRSISYPNKLINTRIAPKNIKPKLENGAKNTNKIAYETAQPRFEKKPHLVKMDPPGDKKLKHSESKDSLVTQSLLNLTSYDNQGGNESDEMDSSKPGGVGSMLHKGEIMSSAILDDPSHENRMSFDDLEQVYKNISRRNILNKVQCSNIHFHAHSDGSTTLHRHKTCRRNSQESIYDFDNISSNNTNIYNNSSNKSVGATETETLRKSAPKSVAGNEGVITKPKRMKQENTYASLDSDEEIYSSLQDEDGEEEEHETSLGPLPVPPRPFPKPNGSKNKRKNGSEIRGSKSCNHCSEEDSVCSMEGCVKFNPFYVREIREKSSGLLRFESGPDNSKTMSVDMGAGHGDQGGQALCGVVLDAVFHAGQVAASHASHANCQDCREFSKKFESNMQGLFMAGYLPSIEGSELHSNNPRNYLDLENGMSDYRTGRAGPGPMAAYEMYPGGRATMSGVPYRAPQPQRAVGTRSQWKMDRRIKLSAYISVVILAALILIIVIVVLTLFFQKEMNVHALEE